MNAQKFTFVRGPSSVACDIQGPMAEPSIEASSLAAGLKSALAPWNVQTVVAVGSKPLSRTSRGHDYFAAPRSLGILSSVPDGHIDAHPPFRCRNHASVEPRPTLPRRRKCQDPRSISRNAGLD
jgi:hypothetical protein